MCCQSIYVFLCPLSLMSVVWVSWPDMAAEENECSSLQLSKQSSDPVRSWELESVLANRTLSFVSRLDERYKCPACGGAILNPHQTGCGHIFCAKCIRMFMWVQQRKKTNTHPWTSSLRILTHIYFVIFNKSNSLSSLFGQVQTSNHNCSSLSESSDASKCPLDDILIKSEEVGFNALFKKFAVNHNFFIQH